MMQPLLTILVPVYNEELTVGSVLINTASIDIGANYQIIIVNDASTDESLRIIQEFNDNFKSKHVTVKIINHTRNKGKGAGIKTALKYATGKFFIIQDADLEYDPKDISKLLKLAKSKKLKVVYGSRFSGTINGMPKPNYCANKFYNQLIRLLYDTNITDMHTCYKMVETELLKSLNMTSNGFGYATELISKLLRRNIRVNEVPVLFNGRTKKQGKKIGLRDGIECTVDIIRYRFSKNI